MKKTLSLVLVAIIALSGCKKNLIQTSEGTQVSSAPNFASEICHKEVTYVKFDIGNNSWGGAKFDKNGKVMQCSKHEEQSFVEESCYQGVVYVEFGLGSEKWGGAMYNKAGNVVVCGEALKDQKSTLPQPDTSGYIVEGTNAAIMIPPKK